VLVESTSPQPAPALSPRLRLGSGARASPEQSLEMAGKPSVCLCRGKTPPAWHHAPGESAVISCSWKVPVPSLACHHAKPSYFESPSGDSNFSF